MELFCFKIINAFARTSLYSNTYFIYQMKPIWVRGEPVPKFVFIVSLNIVCEPLWDSGTGMDCRNRIAREAMAGGVKIKVYTQNTQNTQKLIVIAF